MIDVGQNIIQAERTFVDDRQSTIGIQENRCGYRQCLARVDNKIVQKLKGVDYLLGRSSRGERRVQIHYQLCVSTRKIRLTSAILAIAQAVNAQGDNVEARITEFFVPLFEFLQLNQTRLAPTGPEVYQDGTFADGQVTFQTVEVLIRQAWNSQGKNKRDSCRR